MSRTIANSHQADLQVFERYGTKARYAVGYSDWPEMAAGLDPFIMMNEFEITKPGVTDHPHRGYDHATYMLSGADSNEDSKGYKNRVEPGGLQWLTAGKGVVHCEVPGSDDDTKNHGLQLWVNLKRADKMVEPAYQELLSKDIPKPSKDGVTVVVLAGESLGEKSQVYTRTPTMFLDFTLEPGAKYTQAVPKGWNGFVYVMSGNVHLGPEDKQTVGKPHDSLIMSDGNGLALENKGPEKVHFVLVAGEPINEPVCRGGPAGHFVMNTEEEVRAALGDWKNGRNGFENAPTWKSSVVAELQK
ncbi:pirin-like [Branchiostoma floridae x Branchiostoma japonicum]